MLTMTHDAARLVRRLARLEADDSAGESGLRLSVNKETDSLSMGMAMRPASTDAVITLDGALVFVSPAAIERLSERVLCGNTTASRSVFYFDP